MKNYFKKYFSNNKSTALIEILLAISLFALVGGSISIFSIEAVRNIRVSEQKNEASEKFQEIINAINVIKKDSWGNITSTDPATTYYITYCSGTNKYSLSSSLAVSPCVTVGYTDGLTTNLNITNVNRDGSGNIVTLGGSVDPHTRKLSISISWTDILGVSRNINEQFYVNDWNTLQWLQTTQADFDNVPLANKVNTISTNTSGGEIALNQIFYPDWCKPTTALATYDIPGNATAKTVFGVPNRAYLGTGGNSSGVAFTNLSVTGVTNMTFNVDGTFNGYITNNIFVDSNNHYAYLAIQNNTKKVVILDISHTPYTEVGNYTVSSTTQVATSVYVVGTVGYVSIGKTVQSFNIASALVSKPKLSSVTVVTSPNQGYQNTADASKIVVRGNYLYASLDQDYYELAIVNVTNPSNMSLASVTSVNNGQTFDLYVSTDGNRAYFGTDYVNSEPQFFIVDTSTKTGTRPVIGTYKTTGLVVKAVAIIEADKRAVLVGTAPNGQNNYVALNLNDETHPTSCGGMIVTSGVNDIDTIMDAQGNAFSYFVTNDATNDFQVARGGPGVGGGANGYGYMASGTYTSGVLDSGTATPSYYSAQATATVPANTTATILFRTADNAAMTTNVSAWVNASGTTSPSNLMNIVNTFTWPSNFNRRYLQYMISFTSDTTATPVVSSVKITYQ